VDDDTGVMRNATGLFAQNVDRMPDLGKLFAEMKSMICLRSGVRRIDRYNEDFHFECPGIEMFPVPPLR
jgi:hypothetical protein